MADAKALFRRHVEQFQIEYKKFGLSQDTAAVIYAACILAEAIRTEVYEDPPRFTDFKAIIPGGPKEA